MSDEDSKFSFSERTRVDEGSAPGGDDDQAPQDEALQTVEGEEDQAGKTGVLSSTELKEAGILDANTPSDGPEVAPGGSDSQTYVARTMMLDPSNSEDATVAQVEAIEEPPASDATVAEITSLPPEIVGGSEATVALTEAIEEEPEPEPQVFHLVMLGGSQPGKTYEIREPHRIAGRHADCDLVIQDSSVSRRHFELTRTTEGYRLKDLGSGNGTLVDEEPVSELLLTHGMTIEAGMSRFQWRDPRAPQIAPAESEAQKTQMIDIAQLQRDPSFNPDRRPAAKPTPRRTEPAATQGPRPESDRRHSSQAPRTVQHGRPDTTQVLQWAGFGTLGVLAIIGALSLLGVLPTGDSESSERASVEGTSKAGADILMEEGLEAYKAWRWADAKRLFEAARAQSADKTSADEALLRVAQEELASKVMESVRVSMESSRFQEVIKKLGEVPDTSVYFADAKALINDAKEGIVSGHLESARKLAAENKRPRALSELEAALKILPGDAEVVALMREYQEASATLESAPSKSAKAGRRQARREKPPKARGSKTRRKVSRYDLEPDWPDEPPATKVAAAPLDIAPALSKYSAGRFSDAKRILDRVMRNTDSDRQRSKAKRLISDISAFQNLWKTGRDQAAAENSSSAISSLKRAKVLDKAVSGAYKRRIDRLLADQYATQANNSMLAGKHARAGSLARKALALSSGQSVARSVMEEVRKKADSWLSSAESLLSRNPEKAKTLLTQVLAVFPKRDPRYIRAYGMLKRIDVEDDD